MVLLVKELRKEYKHDDKSFVAVDGISFELKEAEILGLLGANGAGKTTTIQMLLGTLTPSSGKIFYFGKDLARHRAEILNNVVFASTYINLPGRLTVEQNLKVFAGLYGLSKREYRRRMEELLERFGIASKLKEEVFTLSAGQITRLVLVKAFMVRPKVVLLDEPTASLDPEIAKEVCSFVLEQRKLHGISILFTSHKMAEVSEVCDRALFLRDGKIIADDIPAKLARSVSRSKVILQVGDGLKRTQGIAEKMGFPCKVEHRSIELQLDESEIARLLSALAAAGVAYTDIDIVRPTLEDYFLAMAMKKGGKL